MAWPASPTHTYYLPITVDYDDASPSGDETAPVLIVVTTSSLIPKADIASKRYNIYDVDGELAYEEVVYDTADATYVAMKIWVRMPLAASPTGDDNKIRIYYGTDPGSDQDDAASVWPAAAKAILHLDESGNGTTDEYVDSSGSANHGTGGTSKYPALDSADTMVSGSQHFDGTSDYITLGAVTDFDSVAAATISFWAKVDTEADAGNPLPIRHSDGTDYSPQVFYDNNDYRLRWDAGSTHDIVAGPNKASFAYDSWHLVTVVFNSATNDLDYYFNGAWHANATTTGTSDVSGGTCQLGGWNGTLAFDGRMEEFWWYNEAKSADWIKWHWQNLNEADNEQTHGTIVSVGGPTDIAATLTWTWTPTGTIEAEANLAGAPAWTWTPSGTIEADADIGGAPAWTWTPAGTIEADANLAGAPTWAWSPAGTIEADADLIGAPTWAWTPAAAVEADADLAGTLAWDWTHEATIEADCDIVSSLAWAWTPAGTIEADADIVGAIAWTWALTATIESGPTFSDIASTLDWTWTPTGTIEADADLVGAPVWTWTPTATIEADADLGIASTVTIDGNGASPDPSGTFVQVGTLNGQPHFSSGSYELFWNTAYWVLYDSIASPTAIWFGYSATENDPSGIYTPVLGVTGNPIADFVPAWTWTPAATIEADADLSSSPAWAWTLVATIEADADLIGTLAWTWTPAATIEADADLAGSPTWTWTPTGTIEADADLASAPAWTWTATGTIEADSDLAGTLTWTWTPAATIDDGIDDIAGVVTWEWALAGQIVDAAWFDGIIGITNEHGIIPQSSATAIRPESDASGIVPESAASGIMPASDAGGIVPESVATAINPGGNP